MTIREALWDLIAENIPEVNKNIWEPSMAGPDLKTPHIVIRKSSESPKADKYAGILHQFEVWPHVERKTFQALDKLVNCIRETLSDRVLFVGNVPHYIEYDGSSTEDLVIEDWDLLTRSLSFLVHELNWLSHMEVEPDPIEAMKRWTEKKTNYQTNPQTWNPSEDEPALYWRQGATAGVEPMNWGAWHDVRLYGHIINPDNQKRREAVEKIVRQLSFDRVTSMSDKSNMRFTSVSADTGYDAFGQGQITLDVRFGVLKERPRKPLKYIYINDSDKAKGGVVDG